MCVSLVFSSDPIWRHYDNLCSVNPISGLLCKFLGNHERYRHVVTISNE